MLSPSLYLSGFLLLTTLFLGYRYQSLDNELSVTKANLKASDEMNLKLKDEIKILKNELKNAGNSKSLNLSEINGVKVCVQILENGDIKTAIDELKNANEKVAVLLIQEKDDKVLLAAGVKNANLKAGEWVKNVAKILGGNGGGKDDFATAGAKDVSKINDAKIAALEFAKTKLK